MKDLEKQMALNKVAHLEGEIKRLQVHLDGVAQECKDALFREDLLREYKERYPPDYIEKLQQEIDEWKCGMRERDG